MYQIGDAISISRGDAGAKIKIFKQIDIYVGRNRTAICQYSKDYDPSELWH